MNNTAWLVLWVISLFAAWLQPDHFPPWLSFHSEFLAFAAVAVCLVAALQRTFRTDVKRVLVGLPELALGFVVLVVWIQYAVGIVTFSGDVAVLLLYSLGLIFAISTGRAIGGGRPLEMFSWAVLIAGLCSTAIALFQSTRPFDELTVINLMPGWRRPGANLGQANHFGTLALWALGSAVYLSARREISLVFGMILGVSLLFGASMSESRTALIGIWVLAFWLLIVPQQAWSRRDRIAMATVMVVSGTILFAIWPKLLTGIQEGSWVSGGMGPATINTQGGARFAVWPQLLTAVGMRPLAGWGWGGVSTALNAIAHLYPETFPFTYAHNVLLDLLVGLGIPLTITLIGLAGVWMWRRVRTVRDVNHWYAVAVLIPFGLHSMLEFPFAYAYFLFPAGYLVGVLDSGRKQYLGVAVPGGIVAVVLVGWMALGFEIAREYLLAEEDYRVARAEALRVGKTPLEYRRPVLPVLTQLDALNKAIRVVPSPHGNADELELLRMVALRFPSIAVQNRYAMSLALRGDLVEARRQLTVIRSMYGTQIYAAVAAQWAELAREKYPKLQGVPNL